MQNQHKKRDELLEDIREALGGPGAATRIARIARVSKIAGHKWFRTGIPRERVRLFSAMTGYPDYVIRPDEFFPPVPRTEERAEV